MEGCRCRSGSWCWSWENRCWGWCGCRNRAELIIDWGVVGSIPFLESIAMPGDSVAVDMSIAVALQVGCVRLIWLWVIYRSWMMVGGWGRGAVGSIAGLVVGNDVVGRRCNLVVVVVPVVSGAEAMNVDGGFSVL